MNRKALKTCVGILANALGLLLGAAGAQAQMTPPPNPGDWGALGAYVNRQNRNGNPSLYNPGRNELRWTTPNTVPERTVLTLDNTDFRANFFTVRGGNGPNANPSIDDALYGEVGNTNPNPEVALPLGWRGPAGVESEAGSPYVIPNRNRYTANSPDLPAEYAGYAPNLRLRVPSYHFTQCTPSLRNQSDPTLAQNQADLRYFEWTFTPPTGPDRNYAIYAYLPIGPTTENGTIRFSQRYYVYKIFYGNGQSYTDVVDTYAAGNGFVRLGNGGGATNRVFPFVNQNSTGTAGYPIRVRLYNTVPRTAAGQLQIDGSTPAMTIQAEQALAQSRLVYADAARLTPQIGSFSANAVTQTFTPSTTNPPTPDGDPNVAGSIDARVTVALNEYQTSTVNSALQQSTAGTVISYQSNPNRWPITDTTDPLRPLRQTPLEVWRYSLAQESSNATNVDNSAAVASAEWTPATTAPHVGADYLTAPIINDLATRGTVTYAPTLDDGDYSVYAYVGGERTGTFGRSVRFEIYQGATLVDSPVVDLDQPQTTRLGPGWVRVGLRRYRNVRDDQDLTNAIPLRVLVTNYSAVPGDAGKQAFADAIRFVGDQSSAITSTPVHTTVRIGAADTKVVVVADESGRLHCLDATGNTDGTTWEYWSYPSTTTLNDPNLTEKIDGTYDTALGADNVPTAIMPTGFDLSSALVARVQTAAGTTADYLYVGATNGRIYCIDMAGRGDYDRATRKIGTTRRVWTYPDDYPATVQPSDLGAFRGSIVFGNADNGVGATPTIYVPAYQGRVYALNALGDPSTHTTTVRWQYPSATQPTLPNIVMTPTLFRLTDGPNTGKGRLYFGTARSTVDDGPGRLYCLDAETGDIVWQYNGGARNTADPHDVAAAVRYDDGTVFSAANGYQTNLTETTDRTVDQFGAFVTGMVAVPKDQLDLEPSQTPLTHVDELYALNNNRFLYAFNADTGVPITGANHNYATNDLDVLSDASLTFTFTRAYGRNSSFATAPDGTTSATGLALFPTIIVPSNDGRMREAFARVEDYNAFDGYVADGVNFPSALNGAAASNNSTYLTDTMGMLYALDDKGAAGGNLLNNFDYGVNRVVPPNDPYGAIYRNLKIRLVNRTAYNLLRNVDEAGQGPLSYLDATTNANYQGPATSPGQPRSFEWGETAYVMVYDFPYATTDATGKAVPPPTITLTLSVDGKTVRQQQIDTRQFNSSPPAPPVDGNPTYADGTPMLKNGYAIYPFTFNSAGSTALPPGAGKITATISTSAVGGGTGAAEILNDTRPKSDADGSAIVFRMANPLALQVFEGGNADSSIGNTYVADNVGNRVNGSPNIGGLLYSQLLSSAGYANHGGSGTTRFNVYDRSLMVLVRPEGLNNVRLQRSNLERQGGPNAILRPLVSGLYPNFEDAEATAYRPNRSLDYPNIGREQVRATKDPNGNAENPVLTPVTLKPPVALGGGALTQATLGANNERQLVPTPFELTIDVPRYQPPVDTSKMAPATSDPTDLLHLRNSFTGAALPQGYFGRLQVFVDSNNDQVRNDTTNAEAFRSANYSLGVQPQVAILTGTPSVDLGSLAAGTGYDTANPAGALNNADRGKFNPWVGAWRDAYRPISVRNDGNVNLLDLRMAKAYNDAGRAGANRAWRIDADDNDPMASLSAALLGPDNNLLPGSLWSNIDSTFAPRNDNDPSINYVILQKPRVTDRTPTELLVNPVPRPNPNLPKLSLGNLDDYRLNHQTGVDLKPPRTQPNVGISVPLGFPVGNYAAEVRVIENVNADDQILQRTNNEFEPYSDPITVTFKIRETRMTNRVTPKTAPILDDPFNFPTTANGVYDPNLGTNPNDPLSRTLSYRNAAPAALRLGTGGLVVAWESDRRAKSQAGANGAPLSEYPSLIHLAGLGVTGQVRPNEAGLGAPAGNSALWDLTQFSPGTAGQWFTQSNGGNGYPNNPQDLFPGAIASTMRFGSPAFPQSLGSFTAPLMGFVGDAQVQTGTGRLSQSKVFVAPVTANGGQVVAGAPILVPADPQTAKGKPAVLQFTNDAALVFYSETSAGQSGISVSRFVGNGFATPVALDFGDGFSSVFSPSASARALRDGSGRSVVELSFAGKLRGRPNAEVYLGRLRRVGSTLVDGANVNVETPRSGTPFLLLPEQFEERLVNEGAGLYRSRGVTWDRQSRIVLIQRLNGVQTTLNVGAATVERQSGLVSYDTPLGGKVYLDPELGTVKFVGSTPAKGAELRLTYTPSFLRVTPGGAAGYSAVNGLWDERAVSDPGYWFLRNGVAAPNANGLRNDRYFFAYARGAMGGGVTARPYSTTMRLGVRLPTRIATSDNGNVVRVNVTPEDGRGELHPFQVDPANGRVYFMAEDEGRRIRINYVGVNEATNAQVNLTVPTTQEPATVSFVLERDEAPILVDEAVNDSEVAAFLDPFSWAGRPPLVWLFYTSTRAGRPDVYFQTIAPRLQPFAK